MVILRLKGLGSSILGWALCYWLYSSAGLVSAEGQFKILINTGIHYHL